MMTTRILTLFLMFFLVGCASTVKTAEQEFQGMEARQIFTKGEEALAKGKYEEAARYFEGVNTLYPFGDYARQAQLDLIYSYYRNDDVASALAATERYIRLYPLGDHVDYAYYMKGLINMGRGGSKLQHLLRVDMADRELTYMGQAFFDFNILVTNFPTSYYSLDARKRMIYIRNTIAKREVEVAMFYGERQNYVAAINRASYVVQNFQGAPATITALQIMLKAYSALGLNNLANDIKRVLVLNCPGKATKTMSVACE